MGCRECPPYGTEALISVGMAGVAAAEVAVAVGGVAVSAAAVAETAVAVAPIGGRTGRKCQN